MKPSDCLRYLTFSIDQRRPVLMKGAPGIGKTDIVIQAAHASGCDLIVSHPVTADPTDYKGLPMPDGDAARFLPFGDLKKLIDATGPTVFFIDDMGQAPPLVQASLMQLVLKRSINDHDVSEHVTFIAATNRKEDRAAVGTILEPLKSRFTIIEVVQDVEDWCAWARAAQMPSVWIAFVRAKPRMITDFKPLPDIVNSPSARTIAAAARQWMAGIPAGLEREAIAGDIGEGAATEAIAFLDTRDQLPTIEEIIADPHRAKLPEKPDALFLIGAMMSDSTTEQNFEALSHYVLRMPDEFKVFAIVSMAKQCPAVQKGRAFADVISRTSEILI